MRRRAEVKQVVPVKFKTEQSRLGEFNHHELDWQKLLSDLKEMGYPDRFPDSN